MKKIYFTFCLFLLSTSLLPAQSLLSNYIISPLPSLACSTTTITINGTLPCRNAVYNGTTHTISGTTITVNISYSLGIICLPALAPFTQTHTIGMIPAGSYTVIVNGLINNTVSQTLRGTLSVGACCTVNPSFAITDTLVCPGDSVSFASLDTTLTNFTWRLNGDTISQSTTAGQRFMQSGTYTVSLTGGNGSCQDSTTARVQVSDYPQLSFALPVEESCFGSMDGSIDLSVSQGMTPYQFSWSNGATTEDIGFLGGGTYVVTVADAAGCQSTDSVSLADGPMISAGISD